MTAQKTIQPGAHVRVYRPDGSQIDGVVPDGPVAYLAAFGEWYRVFRSVPVRYETRKGKGRGRHTEVDVADEIGLYPRFRLAEVAG